MNLSTGTALVSIPVYTVSRGSVSVPISLEYVGSGILVSQFENIVGTNWQLNAGGAVTRVMRDLPDEGKLDNASNGRSGWLWNTNATKVNNLSITNDNNTSTCTDEGTDISAINVRFSDNSDLEPDIFTIQAPGLSCQIVYDQINQVFRPIPYQDIQISYTLNTAQNSIISFSIVDNKGTQYSFATPESVTQTTSSSNPSGINYFKRGYTLFQNGVTYNQKWYLTRMTDIYGNYLQFSYTAGSARSVGSAFTIYTGSTNTNAGNRTYTLYSSTNVYTPQLVSTIGGYNKLTNIIAASEVGFSYQSTTDAAGTLLSIISVNNSRRLFYSNYSKVPGRTRDFLTSFGETGCAGGGVNYNPKMYQFGYTNVDFSGTPPWIPDVTNNGSGQDYWGYTNMQVDFAVPQVYVYPPNPSFPNLERYRLHPIPGYAGTTYTLSGEPKSVDVSVTTGTLSQIIYPTGGSTALTYQPNVYYDVSAGVNNQGGGARILQTVDYDGLNTADNIVKNYAYTDPVTGLSSGKPACLPQIAFTVPYTGTLTGASYWDTSTVRLGTSFSNQNESVFYSSVTVQQTGAGKKVYQYSTPATFWDATAQPASGGTADWSPSWVYTGRSPSGSSCPGVGSVINSNYTYPFPPSPNYDFERGLPLTVTSYNDAGNIVSKTTNTYQRSFGTATNIPAFKYDLNGGVEAYAKYNIYTATSELISTVTNVVNDLSNTTNSSAQQVSSMTKYFYAGATHKLPTEIETDNTDGSVGKLYTVYSKDYTYENDDFYDQSMSSIKALANLHVNTPVEKYYTVTRSGVEKAMKAELIRYAPFSSGVGSPTNIYCPAQKEIFISSAGVTGFPASFNSGGNFVSYSGYKPTENYTGYNFSGALLSKDDNFKNIESSIVDDVNLYKVATVANAAYNEISYTNFDGSEPRYGVVVTGATYNSSMNRTGTNSLTLPSTGSLTGTLTLKANAKNYIYSCWVNAASAGTLTISVYNTAGTLFGTQTISFASNGSGWTYYEQKINTNGLSGTFSFKVQTNVSINIDDILFYPETAQVETFAYDPFTLQKTAKTNTNGVSEYYVYDQYYRPQYTYDQDHNIIVKRSYAAANTNSILSASFVASPAPANVGVAISFTGTSPSSACMPGTYYSYNFGDGGSTTPSLTGQNATHTYTTAGSYTVTFTLTNSIFGSKSFTQTVSALMVPHVCQSGVWAYVAPTAHTAACPPNPNDNTHSYFTVNSITGLPAGHAVSYQWQIQYFGTGGGCGSTSWTNTGTNVSQLVITLNTSSFCPYNIQCILTDTSSGQQVTIAVGGVSNTLL